MQKTVLTTASSLLLAGFSALTTANQLYLDGGLGIAELDAGPSVDDTYLRLGAGVQLNETIGVEAGFWDLGSSRDNGVRVSADALYGAAKFTVPINNNLNIYGRAGLMRWDADVGPSDEDGHDLFLGGGVNMQAGPGRLGFEVHFSDLDGLDARTIGASYSLPIDL